MASKKISSRKKSKKALVAKTTAASKHEKREKSEKPEKKKSESTDASVKKPKKRIGGNLRRATKLALRDAHIAEVSANKFAAHYRRSVPFKPVEPDADSTNPAIARCLYCLRLGEDLPMMKESHHAHAYCIIVRENIMAFVALGDEEIEKAKTSDLKALGLTLAGFNERINAAKMALKESTKSVTPKTTKTVTKNDNVSDEDSNNFSKVDAVVNDGIAA